MGPEVRLEEKNMRTVDAFALGAVTLCIIGTVECSKKVRQLPPLFASLVFFALSWALLLPYYYLQANPVGGDEQRELVEMLSGYSAILLTLTAVPLRSGLAGSGHKADAINVWVMRSLYLIVVPHSFAFLPRVQVLLHAFTVAITHLLLVTAGLYLIADALWFLTKEQGTGMRALWCILLIVTIVYLSGQYLYGLRVLMNSPSYTTMPDSYKWLYVFLKLAYCSVFLAIILLIGRSQPLISAPPATFGSSQQAPEHGE
jgi:hypothetical protein